jgi:cytochrome c biogenesis protein CcdA
VPFAAAFVAGLLTLLAPCGAMLLPASLAYALSGRPALARRGLLFLAGLATVLLPLGTAAGIVGTLLVVHRSTSILVAGLILVGLGVVQARGGLGLVPARLLEHRLSAYQLGLVYAMGGFCSGPLLGGVLTVAAGSGSLPLAVGLMLVYALGMALPLFVLVAMWQRLELRWVRQHAEVVSGWLLVALGVGFIVFQGSSGLSGLYDDLGITRLGLGLDAWVAERVP